MIVERIEVKENFPIDGEAYAIVTDGTRFAFAWGPKYPYAEEVPAQDVKDGESGLEWFDSEDEARAGMKRAIEAWSDVRGENNSLARWKRKPHGITQITDWLFLGGEDDVDEDFLEQIGVWVDFRHFANWNRRMFCPEHILYALIPFADEDKNKAKSVLSMAKTLILNNRHDKKVLISCHAGASRSALIATWLLAEERKISFDDALAEIKSKRKFVEFHEDFSEFVEELRNKYK